MSKHGKLIVQAWTDNMAEKELSKRLKKCQTHRKKFENGWKANELAVFTPYLSTDDSASTDVQYADVYDAIASGYDASSDMGINYTFKYHRFIHAQMSANPPSVIPKPTSYDHADTQAAKAADAFIHHGRRKLKMQEMADLTCLPVLTYGTGFLKQVYNPYGGDDPLDFDEKTGELIMEGEIEARPKIIWNIWIDSDAEVALDVKYLFERHYLTCEEAFARFPDKKELLKEIKGDFQKEHFHRQDEKSLYEDIVEIFEYYEKATPWNGMAGRHCFFVKSKEGSVKLITPLKRNPHPTGIIPYHILTDVDVPGEVYGKTFVDYIIRLQDVLNALDSTILDNVQAHAVARLVVYDGAELPDEAETNDGWDILQIKGGGGSAPFYINPPTLMPDLYKLRQSIIDGMQQIVGVNDSMVGQVNREMSALSLQTATNAGNMIRRRLFNKYTMFVEDIYKSYLQLVQKHYTDPRKILITGEEGAVSVAYFSSSDLEGGYTLEVDYGQSFSLDPASRREEIMQLIPFLKEAGFSMKQILEKLRLNEISGLFDMNDAGRRRQMEVFEEMIARYEEDGILINIAPEKNQDHGSMLEAAKEFRMTMAFKTLDKPLRDAIDAHIDARLEMAASIAAPAPQAPVGAEAGMAPAMPAPMPPM